MAFTEKEDQEIEFEEKLKKVEIEMTEKRSRIYSEDYEEINQDEENSHSKSVKSNQKPSTWYASCFKCILRYEVTKVICTIILSEMGDRSQIVAIGLAANYDFLIVAIAGSLGHFLALVLAIIFGKIISGYTTERCMNFVGGIMFLAFGVYTLLYGR